MPDRGRATDKRAHGIAAKLRLRSAQGRDEAQATVQRITGELAELAERATSDAEKLLANARRALRRAQAKAEALAAAAGKDAAAGRRRGRLRRAVNDLTELLEVTRRVADQTRQRVAGTTPAGATRRVSLHDPDARPIAKGQLGKPVQFGYQAQVVDNQDGVVLDHNLEQGNPPDAPQLAQAIERVIKRTGRKPRTATADRGYGQKNVEDTLRDLGVRHVVIPRKGKPGKARQVEEHRPAFRKTVKWRTGSEGRISSLKRGHSWDRTRLAGTDSPDLDRTGGLHPHPGQDRDRQPGGARAGRNVATRGLPRFLRHHQPVHTEGRAGYGAVLRNREYLALLVSQSLSVVGDQVAQIALALLVYQRTGSAFAAAATFATAYGAAVVVGPVVSTLADRYPRRTVMVISDVLRGLLVLLLALSPPTPLLYVIIALAGASHRPLTAPVPPRCPTSWVRTTSPAKG